MVLRAMERTTPWPLIFLFPILAFTCDALIRDSYRGKPLGKLTEFHHGVSGEVFAVDARTLHIRNFNYDGEGPAAFFYVGNSKAPHGSGLRLRDERGTTNPLPRYVNRDITLTLPEGTTLHNIRWFSVWCDEFAVNFGDVRIQKGFDFPRPVKLAALSGIHGVSSDPVVVVDAQTLLIPNFSYDGEAPDAKFWVGQGSRPTPQGIRIPDENGKEAPLRRYDRKTIVLTLPNDLTVFDIGHFGVWCEAFTVDFGHVLLPNGLNVPPSLKMLGVSPQSKLNCEVLWDDLAFEVRWAVAGDSIVLQLVSRLDDGEYMAFGLSGDVSRSQMVGGDVTVAWVDKETLKGHAQDYFLDAKSQCSGGRGSCPDERIQERTNNVRLLNAALVNGYSIVTYQRPLKAKDQLDHAILTNQSQPIIWAIGPLNARNEVSYHSLTNRGDIILDFGRPPTWNCPTPEAHNGQTHKATVEPQSRRKVQQQHVEQIVDSKQQSTNRRDSTRPKTTTVIPTPAPSNPKIKPWDIPPIQCNEPEDGVFYAQMGPTGGKHGYSAITGHVGWGISWYINGLLIPEINVVRGRTYTFIVEGGLDPETPARYHPFYITDDPVGGYAYKTPEERANIQIFAGAVQNKQGEVRPTGLGRLCNWTPDPKQPVADEFSSFGAYQRTLRLECDQGEPGIVQWTVDKDTPNTVYYQCYSHRYLGWKINVHDSCELESGSDPVPSFLKPPGDAVIGQSSLGFITPDATPEESVNIDTVLKPDAEAQSSVQHITKVDPPEFAVRNDLIKASTNFANPNDFEVAPKFSSNAEFETDSSKVIKDPPSDIAQNVDFPKVGYTNEPYSPNNVKITYVPQFQFVDEITGEPLDPSMVQKLGLNNEIKNLEEQFYLNQNVNQPPLDVLPNSEQTVIPAQSDQFLNFFHPPQKLPLSYMVEEKENQVPILPPVQFQTERTLPSSSVVFDDKFNQEFIRNYQQLQAEAMANLKKHKQKFHQQFGKPRVQYNLPRRPPHNALPPQQRPPHNALTPQQRPLPPGMFPPRPYPPKKATSKRPPYFASSQKIPTYLSLNSIPGNSRPPTFPRKPTLSYSSSSKFSTVFNPFVTTPLFPTETTLAVNTGFNPETIKVEGGFKPILSSGIAPKISERIDEVVEEAAGDTIGVIDLTKEVTLNKTEEERDLFKNQKPEMFEPMFIPSPPDLHIQQKLKKKHVTIKHRNGYLEHFNTEKGHKYIKLRPRPNLMRRPLYPQNVIPPFKIPLKGGYPEFRNQKDIDEEETSTDFDIIQMGNDTSNETNANNDNIFEIIVNKDNDTENEEIAMANEQRDVYLPPHNFALTYDGKSVSAIAPPSQPDPPKKFDISLVPQFQPFKGDLPPIGITPGQLPQFESSQASRDILPEFPDPPSIETTLKLRKKRSPDHVPGHVGDDHDEYDRQHSHHDHSEHHDHDHDHHDEPRKSSAKMGVGSIIVVVVGVAFVKLY